MGQEISVTEHIRPGLTFLRRFDPYAPVKVAFWLKTEEKDRPYLYVASDAVTAASRPAAYAEVFRLTDDVGDTPTVDPTVVQVVSGTDRVVPDAIALRNNAAVGRYPHTLGPSRVGNDDAEDIYVYPSLDRAAAATGTVAAGQPDAVGR